VLTALDGESALGIYRQQKEVIHLAMLDLIMPGMGGRRCLEELLKVNPKVKAVIASGFAAQGDERRLMALGAKGYVNKRYEIRHMLQAVRDVVDED
jgi:DNA-binding NarL/FixJ family response regulator